MRFDAVIQDAEAFLNKGFAQQALELLEPIISSGAALNAERLTLWLIYCDALRDTGNFSEAKRQLELLITNSLRFSLLEIATTARIKLAFVHLQMFQPEEASELTEASLNDAVANKWPKLQADALAMKAHLAELRGEYQVALHFLQDALKSAQECHHLARQVTVLSDIGNIQGVLGNYPIALDSLRNSSQIAEIASLHKNLLTNGIREGFILLAMGETDQGTSQLERISAEAHRLPLPSLQFEVVHRLGAHYLESREYDKARTYLLEADALAWKIGLARHRIFSAIDLARLYVETNKLNEAVGLFKELWQSMQPLQLTHFAILPQFLREVSETLPVPDRLEVQRLSQSAEDLAKRSGIFDVVGRRRAQESFLGSLRVIVPRSLLKVTAAHRPEQLKKPNRRPYRFKYDVALSFAGEDRALAENLASLMKGKGIKVFYDAFEVDELWGKELYEHLDHIYRYEARYCLMLLSQHYARKQWTNHERRSAQARAFEENEEYILPVRLDDTDIPGVRPTTGYLDVRKITPQEIVEQLHHKLLRGSSKTSQL